MTVTEYLADASTGTPIVEHIMIRYALGLALFDWPKIFPPDYPDNNTYIEETWFWTEYWQEKEREAEHEIALGQTMRFESADELIDYLDRNR